MARERPSITDWVQTIVIVLAAIVATIELYFSSDASELEKARNTVEFLKDGYNPEVMEAVAYFARGPGNATAAHSGPTEMLVRLAPYHEYLVAFAVVMTAGCVRKSGRWAFLCGRMMPYEAGVPAFFERFDLTYDAAARPLRATRAWQDCMHREAKA